MSKALDLLVTTTGKIMYGIGGAILKNISGVLAARNSADNADAILQASRFWANDDVGIVINADAAGTGSDRSLTLQRSGSMTANVTLTLPPSGGTVGQYLGVPSSTGVLDWVTPPTLTAYIATDSTVINFNSSSPVALFTLPANARILAIEYYATTPYVGGTPTLSVGVTGNVASYAPTTAFDLKDAATAGVYEYNPNNSVSGTTTALIATLTAGGATAGSGELVIYYANPS